MQVAEIESMRTSDDETALIVDAVLRPVRLPDTSCAGELGGWVDDEGNPEVVWAFVRAAAPNVLADESLLRPETDHGACPPVATTIEVALATPIGERDLMVDGTRWAGVGDGTVAACTLPGCDPATGDPPAPATCADTGALVDDVRMLGDTGMHAGIVELRCEGGYAMVEADIGAGACGPTEGGPNPCAGTRIDRLFLRAGSPHWEVMTRTREAGCGGVFELAPDYPPALCQDLPAVAGG